jgi:DNA-binding NarL/FixJ family response regulator
VALEAARAIFDELGMPLWVRKTDAEIARIGLRRGASLELTETERRIAELAATGLTNREIASEGFVSPKTVEDVMSRVYGKLGIRSRAELGARMAQRG